MAVSHKSGGIDLYEIKHSEKAINSFSKCLRDQRLPQILRQVFGKDITGRVAVLYRGDEIIKQNIKFLNVHDFLTFFPCVSQFQ